jgi:hypothetical protein
MKQQEIFKKVGGIIKELNEQYEYLESQNGDFSDLDLELFAASAHFLTDHTEILKKLNQHTPGSKPAIATSETLPPVPQFEPVQTVHHHHPELPVDEDIAESFATPLPPLAESAVVFDEIPEQKPVPTPAAEPEPAPQQFEVPAEPIHHEPVVAKPATEAIDVPAPSINIEPARQDFYSYQREEAQTAEPQHDFSISSHADEPEPAVYTVPVQPDPVWQNVEPVAPEPSAYQFTNPEPAPPVFHQPASQPEPTPVFEQPVSTPNSFTPPSAPAPKTEEPVLTLNQRLSAQLQGNTNTASTYQGQTVSDLKSAINLNDKMLFVKDLFNGYSLAYSEVVDILNRQKSFDEADRFLKANYTAKYNWADKPATVEKFYHILQRRFPQ